MMDPTIEELILSGIVEVSGMDAETGNFLYSFTPKLQELMPEMWHEKMKGIYKELIFFWEEGFVELDEVEGGNPIVSLTELAFDRDLVAALPEDKRQMLQEIIKMFEDKE